MKSDGWQKRIGDSGWEYLTQDQDPDLMAELLNRIYELGFRGPDNPPEINVKNHTVLWKDGESDIPVLTTEGLLNIYERSGHRFFLLRMKQLLQANAGPNASRLQEILLNYTSLCEADKVSVIPSALDHKVLVGGSNDNSQIDPQRFVSALLEE